MKITTEIQRKKIRKQMKLKRQQLTKAEQTIFSNQILCTLLQHQHIFVSKYIAIFLSFKGEINTYPLIKYLWVHNKKIFLPILNTITQYNMLFLHYCPDTKLIKNYFNISEPVFNLRDIIPIRQLDILFVPLVAFDKEGQRLGMGGGFYDRILVNWQKKHFYPIGLAYDFQLVNKIPSNPWDIPLPEIITPSKIWYW